ncbi:maleylpyruvate isomerase family mycothiol-dependent enzyme [Catenuloplanes sp. NPDC051500]|uniref:maleylpyruvate isomerase family mycothiol-dependent enzyme n=1 Tax=Catenuloplanes sp. NPDC051500 TaxID=3363959 RepID=UPI0037B1CDC0
MSTEVGLDYAGHLAALRGAVGHLVDLVADADPATPVPACPGWDLGALSGHIGATHRWAEAMVASGMPRRLPFDAFAADVPHDAGELTVWLLLGAQQLLATLESTDPDRPVWTFGHDRRAAGWPRRMLHEAVVHGVDAAEALRLPSRVDAAVARDGIEEFLGVMLHHPAILRRLKPAGEEPLTGTLILAAADTGEIWRVDLGRSGPLWRRVTSTADGDAVVLGGISELYLYLWHRIPAPTVMGSPDLVAQWSRATTL